MEVQHLPVLTVTVLLEGEQKYELFFDVQPHHTVRDVLENIQSHFYEDAMKKILFKDQQTVLSITEESNVKNGEQYFIKMEGKQHQQETQKAFGKKIKKPDIDVIAKEVEGEEGGQKKIEKPDIGEIAKEVKGGEGGQKKKGVVKQQLQGVVVQEHVQESVKESSPVRVNPQTAHFKASQPSQPQQYHFEPPQPLQLQQQPNPQQQPFYPQQQYTQPYQPPINSFEQMQGVKSPAKDNYNSNNTESQFVLNPIPVPASSDCCLLI